jgi:hypothetical protein
VIPKTGFRNNRLPRLLTAASGITIGPGDPRLDEDFGLPAWQLGS